MDESNAIRAITIGVSTLIAIATISAVLMYYNTAKATVQEIGTGVDLYGNYASYVKDILVKPNDSIVSGTDVINITNYFYQNPDVQVDISKIRMLNGDKFAKTLITNFNNTSIYNGYIYNILPTQNVKINVEQSEGDKLKITLTRN